MEIHTKGWTIIRKGGGVRRVKKPNAITGKQDDQGKKVHLRILTSPKIPIPSQSVSQSVSQLRRSLISHDFLNEIQ